MSKGINKVILVGNLGKDPETRQMQNGGMVTNITIATSETWKDKVTGEQKEKAEWHRVVFFNRLAEIAAEYLNKGSKVYIEGSLQTRKWQDKSGQDRYTTEIKANEMQMLDGRRTEALQPSVTKPNADGRDVFDYDVPFPDSPTTSGFISNEDPDKYPF